MDIAFKFLFSIGGLHMKALLYGSGAVGLGLAASLLDSGFDVDIKARNKTKEALDNGGLKRTGLFKEINISKDGFRTFENLDEIKNTQYDYILICTKTNSNPENAADISKHNNILSQNGKIVIFQNGWGNDEEYLKYFSKDTVYSGRVITGFARPMRNVSKVTVHSSPVLIGSLYKKSIDCVKPLAEGIDKGGIPCETTEEIGKVLWAKMLYNCTLNPLGAVLNVNYGKLVECENSINIMNHIIDEIYKVMNASGYETYWKTPEDYKKDFYEKILPPTYGHRSSTLQDIERKIKTEIDTLTGSIVKLGKKHNIEVPYNEMIYNLIKTIESYF